LSPHQLSSQLHCASLSDAAWTLYVTQTLPSLCSASFTSTAMSMITCCLAGIPPQEGYGSMINTLTNPTRLPAMQDIGTPQQYACPSKLYLCRCAERCHNQHANEEFVGDPWLAFVSTLCHILHFLVNGWCYTSLRTSMKAPPTPPLPRTKKQLSLPDRA
jgi:hypothetical protein